MIYLSEQLKSCRKSHDYTQEDVAAALHVSAQSVSKWERGETYPDIELLPALANLFETSIDTLMGMDRIYADQQRGIAFSKAHAHFRTGDYSSSCDVLQKQLDIFPNDMSLMSELAFCMSFDDNLLQQAIDLCEMALQRSSAQGTAYRSGRAQPYVRKA